MKAWNSTLKAGNGLQRKTPMNRKPQKRGPGLAQRIAESLGRAVKHARGESSVLRSEEHRKNIKALPCVVCKKTGPSDPAHVNATKGMGIKACDSLLFPACREHRRAHDQGGIHSRLERWKKEWEYVDATRALLIQKNQWPAHIEEHYQRAIVPLARVVHGDACGQ